MKLINELCLLLASGFLLYFQNVKADNFDNLISTRDTILKAGALHFDGENSVSEYNNWYFVDGRPGSSSVSNNESKDWQKLYTSMLYTLGDTNENYIPRKNSVLTFMTPNNFWMYDPNKGYDPNDKDTNIYTHINNLQYSTKTYSYTNNPNNGFFIKDHSKPASLIIKKVAFANGEWIDMVYKVTLEGENGGRKYWTTYYHKDGDDNFTHNRDVCINIGNRADDTKNWLSVTSDGAYRANYFGSNTEAARWILDIKFVKDRSTFDDPDPDETDDAPVNLSGTYQIFNANLRKIIAFDKGDLEANVNKIWAVSQNKDENDSTGIVTKMKGHEDSNTKYIDFIGSTASNGGDDKSLALIYLFNNGRAKFTNVKSYYDAYNMYINTSNNAIVRAEIPFGDIDTTTNDLGTVRDSTGSIITPIDSTSKYSPTTVQFKVLQQFPPQPYINANSPMYAPTNLDIKNIKVPNYVTLDKNSIEFRSLMNDSTITIPLSQNLEFTQGKYNYYLDTSDAISSDPNGYHGIENNFFSTDLNFNIDWDKLNDQNEAIWKDKVVKKNGIDYVKVQAQFPELDVYKKGTDSNNPINETKTTTDAKQGGLKESYTSYVRVPKNSYNLNYFTTMNASIPVQKNQKIEREIGSEYDISKEVSNYLTDNNGKDYKFDHAQIGDKTISDFASLEKQLKSLRFTYNNGKPKNINLYYNNTVGRATFHYWESDKNQKVDPSNYYSSDSKVTPPKELYALITSFGSNYTVGDVDTQINEELPAEIPVVSKNKDDLTSDKLYHQGAPAPKIEGKHYLGYYQYVVGKGTKFYPYNSQTEENSMVKTEYVQGQNQIIVFVYSTDNNRVLKVSPKIDFGKGTIAKLGRYNQDGFSLILADSFNYADKTLQWPMRQWQLSVSANNLKKNEDGEPAPKGTYISFSKTPKTSYSFTVNGNETNPNNKVTVDDAIKSTWPESKKKVLLAADDNGAPLQLLNVSNLKDFSAPSPGSPVSKTEKLELNWDSGQLYMRAPFGITAGDYTTQLTWTMTNSLD